MAEYTGKGMTLSVAGGTTLEGITKVEINDEGPPAVEQLDTTASADSTYTSIPQPLGGKGAPKATVKVTVQALKVGYADSKASKLALTLRRRRWRLPPVSCQTMTNTITPRWN